MNFTEDKTEDSVLLDAIPAGIICLNYKEQLILLNDKAYRILNIKDQEAIKGDLFFEGWNFIEPDLTPVTENDFPHKKAIRTGLAIEDAIIGLQHKKNGSITWVNFSATPKPNGSDKNDSRLVIVIKDISKRVNEMRSLHEKENIYKALVDNMQSGLMIVRDKRIIYVNQVALDISGYEDQDILGKRFLEFVHPSERNRIRGMYLKRLAGISIPDRYRSKALKKGGGFINVDVAVSLINHEGQAAQMVVMNDIDDEVQARSRLEASEIKYQTIVDSIDQGIITVDLRGRIIYVNSIFSEITGICSKEVVDKNVIQVFRKFADGTLLVQLTKMFRHLFSGNNLSANAVKWRDKYFEISGKYESDLKQIFVFLHDITDLKQSTIQLSGLSRRLSDVVKSADVGTWELHLQENKLVINEKSAGFIGYSLEEIKDDAINVWYEHIFHEDLEIVNSALNEHIRHESDNYSVEFRMKCKTGCLVWIHSTGKVSSYSEDGKPLVISGIHQDISRRKKSEKIIKESERQLSTLMNNLPGLVYRCLNDNNWTMLFLSAGCKDLTGYMPEELLKSRLISYGQLIHSEDRARVNESVKKALENNLPFEIEYRILSRQGKVKYVWERGAGVYRDQKLIYIEGFVTDITERQQSKEELEHSEKRFKQIAEQSQTVIWEVDEVGLYTFVSPLSLNAWGYKPEELVGKKHFYDIHPEEGKEAFKNAALTVFEKHEKFHDLHNAIVKKDGSVIWVTTNGSPVYDIYGRFIGYRGSDKDVTDLVNFEKDLKISEQKYRSIFENIQDAYYEASADGKILEISPSIEHLSGGQYKREELIGKSILDMYADPAQREKLYQKFKDSDRISDFEILLKNKDGSEIPVAITSRMMFSEKGETEKIIGIIRNIEDRKKSEQELKESEERYKSIFRDNKSVMLLIDPETGAISDANNAACEFYGWTYAELTGKYIFDLNMLPKEKALEELSYSQNNSKIQFFYQHKLKNNNIKHVEVFSSPIHFGAKVYLYAIVHDISERRKAEKALLKSEANLKFAQQIAKMGSWEHDFIKNRNTWSDNFYELSGYTRELFEPSFDNFIKLVHEEDRHLFEENLANLEKEKSQISFDYRLKVADGSYHWMQNDIVPEFKDGRLSKLIGTNIDITDKKEAAKQLADSERFYKVLFENSGTALTVIDIKGNMILANTKAVEITNGTRKNIEGANVTEFLEKEQAERLIKETAEFIRTGESRVQEQTFNLHTGIRTFIVIDTVLKDENGKGYALLSSSLDITDKKEYQEKIRLMSAAVEQSPNGIMISNTRAEVEYANTAFTESMGYTADEIRGKTAEFLLSMKGEQREAFFAELYNTLNIGKSWRGEVLDVSKSGKKMWFNNIVSPVYNEDGVMTHYVFTREDVTEKKKMWEDLVVAKEKAEESNKLKSTFLATMSHELRTPLNHVIGFSELIQDISDDEEIVEFARTINSSGNGLLEIIEDIFNLALYEQSELRLRIESYKLMNIYIELKDQLKEILNASGKESNIELHFSPESGLLGSYVDCDKNKVKQVIVNLFKNAVKFTEEGFIEFGFYQTDTNSLAFYVKDTGVGIPADKISMIFDFFRQADETHSRNFGGVGIGLAISRKIADAMKGSITVESIYGEGAVFTFTFPAKLESAVNGAGKNGNKPELDLSGFKILLVEDDPASMQLASRLISETTATVFTAENGKMAVDIADSVEDLDLVLMDLKMPVMDGFEATEKICAKHPDLQVIALTSYNFDADRQKAIGAGCRDIITKPVNKKLIQQKLKEYLFKI
ncbi:PAS domain S-box protein [Saccharicrinis sp. FJH54]|uniref:PAS domain S-box protein n=1 Tax=Saccharicrinis sp. FJH54 TaxID=3344665 RepID=UPI0035D45642